MKNVNPTKAFYAYLDHVGACFNEKLFDAQLPHPLFTLRRGGRSLGHFSGRRWSGANGKRIGEITLNPELFSHHSLLSLFETIVQAQCDMWQHLYGDPSRPGYRNKQWVHKMNEIGLRPSATGELGCRQTGQSLRLFPQPGGRFLEACSELATDKLRPQFVKPWIELPTTLVETEDLQLPRAITKILNASIGRCVSDPELQDQAVLTEAKRKAKYMCLHCDVNVWGRSGLGLICSLCTRSLKEVKPDHRARIRV